MSISRRTFMAVGSVAGGGFIIARVAGTSVFAQPDPALRQRVPLRRSLKGMALNDPILDAWREGVRKMKAPAAANPFKWATLANIHGTAAGFNRCPHGNWYFLPWHRAYLTMYERKVRELTNFADFALPYWDWTSEPTLPPAFTAPMHNSLSNPLFATRSLTGAVPPSVVGQPVITALLGQSPYEVFGTSRPNGQNDLSPTWISRRTGVQGILEANPHNQVHSTVGGLMGGFRSANDPIFMMHHCNIDRLWAVWNAAGNPNSSNSLWTDMPFTSHFFNNDGSAWSPKVSELLVPEKLGYTYSLRQLPDLTAIPEQWRRFERVFSLSPGEEAAGITRFSAVSAATARVARPLSVAVPVTAAIIEPLLGRGARGAGEEILNGPAAADPSRSRTIVIIRNIAVTNELDTEFRVFLNQPSVSAATPISSPNYVGAFGFFGAAGHADHGKPSVMLDLTDAIGRVFPADAKPAQLMVQIQPVTRPGRAGATAGTATPEAIEIVVVEG